MRTLRFAGLVAPEIVLVGQLVLFGTALGPSQGGLDLGPADAAAAQLIRDAASDTSVVRTAAADGCTVDAGTGGGVVGSCDDVADFEAFSQGWRAALAGIHAQNGTSHVVVSSDPSGADVLVNEVLVGQTPIDVAVPAGAYLVKIRKEGYAPFTHGGTVTPDAPATITKKLVANGGKGLAVPINAATLLGLVGSDAIADGDFEIDDVIRDRDGSYYVAFWNSKEEHFPKPVIGQVWPDIGDNYIGTYGSDLHNPTTQGVAKSTDGGRTWTLVAKWIDKQTWTLSASKQFQDADWNKGTPNAAGHVGITQHWVRIAYEDHTGERYEFGSFIPRADGGITIQVWKRTTDVREIQGMYDNLPAGWCRADDPDFGKNPSYCFSNSEKDVYRYIDRDYLNALKDPDDKNTFLKDRFGMTDDDLKTWNDDTSVVLAVDDSGSSAPIAGDYSTHEVRVAQRMWLDYIGRYVDPSTKAATDYFLQYQRVDNVNNRPIPASGRIFASSDGGRSVALYAEFADADAKQCQSSEDQCFPSAEVGPDGRIYVRSMGRVVYRVERGSGTQSTLVRLGSAYVTKPNRTLPLFRVDSAGNAHELSREPSNTGRGYDLFYQYFSAKPVAYEAVELVTTPNCGPCELAANYLSAAAIPFTRTDRPGAYAADAYPVLKARVDGADQVVEHANATSIARTLGVSFPAFIGRHLNGFYDLTMDGDEPVVVVRDDDGSVTALHLVDGAWTPTPLTGNPDAAGGGYAVYMTGEWPFNQPGPRPDGKGTFPYTFLYENGGRDVGNDRWQSNYQLWTDETAPVAETYQAVQQVSQLIPAATFEVFLGDHGNARAAGGCGLDGSIVGDICSYLQDNTLAETDGVRTDLVTVDLRKGNETAVDGNIVGRTIGGSMTIDTVDEDGKPDVRTVGLLLLVDNQRLVVWDPELNGAAHDLSTEGVHFTGADERWTIVNNLALPNSSPCGPDQALYLPAQSVSSYTPKDVAAFELPCLQSLEVPPTPISGTDSWETVKQRLADETIDALAQSLPLLRSSSRVTNWELAFGSRDATIRRIVSLDHLQVPAGVQAGTAVDGKTAAIVTISGRILGGPGEAFAPTVTVGDTGTAAVVTASTDDPGELAWERQYLEVESQFIEAQLKLGAQSPDLMRFLSFSWEDKHAAYQTWLIATRALLHCNAEGRSFRSVELLVARELEIPGALRGTSACLADFLVNPAKHWPTLDPTLLPATAPTSLAETIHTASVQDATLQFLDRWASRDRTGADDPQLFGRFLVKHAELPWPNGWSSVAPGFGFDMTFDDIARLETATFTEFTGARGAVMRAVLLSRDEDYLGMRTIRRCAESFGKANPWPDLIKLTSKEEYTAGIPCVDKAGTSDDKVTEYHRLAVAMRGGLFGALLNAAGGDADLLSSYIRMAVDVTDEVDATKAKYGEATTLDAWSPDLPALDRYIIVARHHAALLKARAKRWTVEDFQNVSAGFVECGVGQVKALVIGAGMAVVGEAALAAGGWIAIGGTVVFLGTGGYLAVDASAQLANAWSSIDLTAKTAGLCGAVIATVMAGNSLRSAPVRFGKIGPRNVIDVAAVKAYGTKIAATFTESTGQLAPQGGEVTVEAPLPPPPPLPAALLSSINQLPEGERPIAIDAANRLKFTERSAVEQEVFINLLDAPRSGISRELLRMGVMADAASEGKTADPEFIAYRDLGGELIEAFASPGPRSVAAAPPVDAPAPLSGGTSGTPALASKTIGSDAAIERAVDDAGYVDPNWYQVLPFVGGKGNVQSRQPFFLRALLESDRTLRALTAPDAEPLAAPVEALDWYVRARKAFPDITPSFFSYLTSTSFPTSLRAALASLRDLHGGAYKTAAVEEIALSQVLEPGNSKVAVRVAIKLHGLDDPVEFVVAKGDITPDEAAVYATFGKKEITQNLLTPLLEHVDGEQAVLVTEYIPGRKVTAGAAGVFELIAATGEPDYASAIGALDARIWLRTGSGSGATKTALANLDLHVGNINVYLRQGRATARVVDWDPARTFELPANEFWGANFLKRTPLIDESSTAVENFDAYLKGMLDEFITNNGGDRADAMATLREAAAALRDDATITNLTDPGATPKGSYIPMSKAEAIDIGSKTADLIDAFLQKQRGGAVLSMPFAWGRVEPASPLRLAA